MMESNVVVVTVMDGCLHLPSTLLTLVQYPALPGIILLRVFIFRQKFVLFNHDQWPSLSLNKLSCC